MKAELIAHFCLTYPAYRTARPGMLCRPTNVAAASCHALLPLSSHLGDGTSITCSLSFLPWRSSQFLPPNAGRMRARDTAVEASGMPAALCGEKQPANTRFSQIEPICRPAGRTIRLKFRHSWLRLMVIARPPLQEARLWLWIGKWQRARNHVPQPGPRSRDSRVDGGFGRCDG